MNPNKIMRYPTAEELEDLWRNLAKMKSKFECTQSKGGQNLPEEMGARPSPPQGSGDWVKEGWVLRAWLRQKVDDIRLFIRQDLEREHIPIDEVGIEKIARMVRKFEAELGGAEVWFYDNGETLYHTSGFVGIKDGECVAHMYLWQS